MRDAEPLDSRWLPGGLDRAAGLRLFCFPHAGGGASAFRSWGGRLPKEVDLCPVQLPGRETRIGELPFGEMRPMVRALRRALAPCLDRPYILYGHSMGALIVFELAREMRLHGDALPEQLVVSGRAAPHLAPDRPPLHALADEDLVSELRRLGGTPDEVLDCRELTAMMLPCVRADFAVCEKYSYEPQPPLPCPMVAAGGTSDPEVPRGKMEAWQEHTSGRFTLELLAGDHFFAYREESGFLNTLTRHVVTALRGVSRRLS